MDVVILLGAPGSGKGTVAGRLVAADKTLRHVSSGELLRDAVEHHTAAGDEADAYMKRGELVPDALIARIVADLMAELDGPRALLLDGFPRTVVQAQALDRTIESCGASLAAVVLLEVPDEILVDRIAGRRMCSVCGAGYHVTNLPPRVDGICDACGGALKVRKDDNPETAKNRLAVYQAQTVPLIEFYEARGVLRRVQGTGPIDEIVEGARRTF